jgi:hypothetical protein
MKNQLRKITVENNKYVYTIRKEYESGADTLVIRMFLRGQKSMPLIIHFVTYCDTLYGHPLYAGVDILNHITNSMEHFIIHKPKYIRGFILEAIKAGWTGTNRMEIQNGIEYLNNLGLDVSSIVMGNHK